jgi:hypothetical protein
MLETNVRIVYPGPSLYIWTRHARVTGSHIDADRLERACKKLQAVHGLAAVPARSGLLVNLRE